MFKNWEASTIPNQGFKKNYNKIHWLIELISNIRSTKVDLEVSPGSFIDISTESLKSETKNIINDNLNVFKRLARVSKVHKSKLNMNSVNIISGTETITLYFNTDINLLDQKIKITNKVKNLDIKVNGLNKKLKNESFLKNAPKSIIQKEKNYLINLNNELKKLNSILNSIKN
jgi:valyl-tRNA synthetase